MENLNFSWSGLRAKKARFGGVLSGTWSRVLLAAGAGLAAGGVTCLVFALSVGWVLIGLAAVLYMLSAWYNGELRSLPAGSGQAVDAMLAADVLAKLPARPSPRDFATAIGSINSGLFYAARFGLTPRLLQEVASDDPKASAAMWEEALQLQKQIGLSQVTAGILIVSLIKAFPQHEGVLAHLNIDLDDIISGVRWQQHIEELIAHHTKPKRSGGIGRDWAFGYIPLLRRYGQNISEQIARGGLLAADLESHARALDQLVETFSQGGKQNAALVGAAGTGKTTIVHAFAERLLDASSHISSDLQFRQVIILDAASLLAAAPGRGELEGLIMQVLGEAYSAKNVIICLDNAELFFEEGIGSVDLTNVLLPILEAGQLRMILTMDEQRFLQIGSRNAGLINALNRISVAPATKDETISVLQDHLILTEYQKKVTVTYQAVEEAYRLSERYVHDLAMPGRAIKLLDSAASYAENGLVTINSMQKAIEETVGVKVGVATGEDERDRLLHLEELIHQRMINQTRAVSVVSDALRRARAGVRNQNRPIGTFLFLGPTGVGKTELSKALADVYFGGEQRMIRLDLNEFVRPDDVARLIADGADDPSSLTAQAMKQPFSVVLLDEIEKAHPQVLTTLLQLLDEGILRDVKNREISFRDAIIIATSNAGAERIREYIDRGYQLDQFEQQFTDELISSNQFRPEFLNRFDEIVIFTPLGKDELLQVVDLILAGINKTLALQKISVVVDNDAKQMLVDKGYDPRLGARPMRRVVQRAVENTVAKQMLSGSVQAGATVRITLEQIQTILGSAAEAENIISEVNST